MPSLAAREPLRVDQPHYSPAEHVKAIEAAKMLRARGAQKEAEAQQEAAADEERRRRYASEVEEALRREKMGMQTDAIERWQKDAEEPEEDEAMEDLQTEGQE